MELVVMIFCLVAAISVCLITKNRWFMGVATVAAAAVVLVQAVLVALKVASEGSYSPSPFIYINSLSAIVVLIVGVVGFFAALYSVPYLGKEASTNIIGKGRVREYFVLLNLFVAVMLLSVTASQPVVTWILLEATTLSTAFLISFYNKPSTIEAAWKYLIINSTGLLLGFFGTLLYLACLPHATNSGLVTWQILGANAPQFDPVIAKMAFIFVLIGYGTKAGLAPMHTWKPDAYSKTPAPIGALFSGALLPVAFVALLKFKAVTDLAVGVSFSQMLLLVFGFVSILLAAFSILAVRNYKRLLAYSSIEHVGIMALGFGFGGVGAFAGLLHMIYHSLIKSSLFFTSGNLMVRFHSAKIANVQGALNVIPATGVLFFAGFVAIIGLPPFGMFLTEVLTLSAGIKAYLGVVVAVLLLMIVAFLGFFKHATAMMLGEVAEGVERDRESFWLIFPPLALLAVALILSFHIPQFLQTLLHEATSIY